MIKLYFGLRNFIISVLFNFAVALMLLTIGSGATLYYLSQHSDQLCQLKTYKEQFDKYLKGDQ